MEKLERGRYLKMMTDGTGVTIDQFEALFKTTPCACDDTQNCAGWKSIQRTTNLLPAPEKLVIIDEPRIESVSPCRCPEGKCECSGRVLNIRLINHPQVPPPIQEPKNDLIREDGEKAYREGRKSIQPTEPWPNPGEPE